MSFHLTRPHFPLSPLIIPCSEEETSRAQKSATLTTTSIKDNHRPRLSPSPLIIPVNNRCGGPLSKSPININQHLSSSQNLPNNEIWSECRRYSSLQIDSTATTDTDEYVISPNGTLITAGFKISASGVVSATDNDLDTSKSVPGQSRSHSHAHISIQALTGFTRLTKSNSCTRNSPYSLGHSNGFRSASSSLASTSFCNASTPTTTISTCSSTTSSDDCPPPFSRSPSQSQLPRLPSLSGSFRCNDTIPALSDDHSPVFTVGLRPNDLVALHSIGVGQNGQVMLAFHIPTLTCVALKTISVYDRCSRHQLVKELYTYGKLSSPYLVSFLGAYHEQGRIFMALEYMDSGSLFTYVQKHAQPLLPLYNDTTQCKSIIENSPTVYRSAPISIISSAPYDDDATTDNDIHEIPELRSLTEPQIAEIARQSLLGLQYLHSNNRVHRDIKPENLLIHHNGSVKIADFGLTTELLQSQPYTASFLGTMAYLSPERVAARSYKYPADIWSLGMSLVYCATCLPPTTENGVDYWKIANTVHNLSCSQSTSCDSFLGTPHSVGCSPSSRAASDVQSPMSKSPREIIAPSFVPFTISAKYHSAELRSFLSACLVIDPDQRATAVELLNHPFILKYSCSSKKSSTNPLATRPDSSVVENLFEILLSRNEQSNLSPTNLQHLSNMGIDWSMDSSFADTSKSAKAIASAAALDDIDSFAVPVLEENTSDNYESQHFTSSTNVLGTYELDDVRLRYLGDQFAISADEVRRRLFEFQRR